MKFPKCLKSIQYVTYDQHAIHLMDLGPLNMLPDGLPHIVPLTMQYHTHPHSLYSIELWPCIFKKNVSISYGNLNGGEFPDRVTIITTSGRHVNLDYFDRFVTTLDAICPIYMPHWALLELQHI